MEGLSEERLHYVQAMLRELHEMTKGDAFLSYLLEVAYLETVDALRKRRADAASPEGDVAGAA